MTSARHIKPIRQEDKPKTSAILFETRESAHTEPRADIRTRQKTDRKEKVAKEENHSPKNRAESATTEQYIYQ